MGRRLLRLETIVFFVVWLGLLAAGRSKFFEDPGTFWHTVVGEQTLTKKLTVEKSDLLTIETQNGSEFAVRANVWARPK